MSLINVVNLTFSYDSSYENIFEDVSFHIDTDWKLGFIGRNGRGKTTFLQLLMNKYEYRGTISANVNFDYFPMEIDDYTMNTIDIIGNIVDTQELWMIKRELSLLYIPEEALYRPFCTLSEGERTKVLLAAMFLKTNNFLLIDEPTNHLDIHARETIGNYLKSKKGFILVSHDRNLLDFCVDHILVINQANIEIQKGNFSTWWHNKKLQDDFENDKNEKLKKEIKHMSEAAKRTENWSNKVEKTKFGTLDSGIKPDKGYIGHKSAKMMKRSKSIEARKINMIEEKTSLLKNIEKADSLAIRPKIHHSEKLIEFTQVSIFYDTKIVCGNTNFSVCRGDRVCIKGKNGSGKSSILKLIIGENITYTGDIKLASNLDISFVPQDTSFLSGSLKEFINASNLDESLFKAILRKLGFSRIQFEKDMSDFSEGQKKKVLISKSLCEKAHIYVWDEPLNYVDVISRMQIEDLIAAYKPTMLFVEHDAAFAENISTKTVNL